MKTLTGTLKWFDHKKGYGFIVTSDGDVFVHKKEVLQYAQVRERLNPGAKVTFMLETTSDQRVRAKGAYLIDA